MVETMSVEAESDKIQLRCEELSILFGGRLHGESKGLRSVSIVISGYLFANVTAPGYCCFRCKHLKEKEKKHREERRKAVYHLPKTIRCGISSELIHRGNIQVEKSRRTAG